MTRIALADFETNNPLYAGAQVGILAVTEDVEAEWFLEVFANPVGDAILPNPQILNAQGRWSQPVYVESDYRLSITSTEFKDHETGIRRLGVLAIAAGDGIGVDTELGVVTVRVSTPFTADEKMKLASVTEFKLWRDVVRDLGDQIANDDRFMVGQASDSENRNGFITGLQLKAFIGTVAGSFHLWTNVTNAIGTDVADDDRMLIGDKTSQGQLNKWVSITNLKTVFGSRFAAIHVAQNYAVVDNDYGKAFFVNTASASRWLDLPSRAAEDAGFRFWVYKTASANTITVEPDGAALIDGANSFSMTRQGEAALILWNGSAWNVLAHETPGLTGFDLYEEITTALIGSLSDSDRIAVAAVNLGGKPNRFATASQFKDFANTVVLGPLADGVSIAWDVTDKPNAVVTLGGNRSMAAPTNPVANQFYVLTVKQDATGGRTLDWNAAYDFTAVGGTPSLTAEAGKSDKLVFVYEDFTMKCLNIVKGL